MEFGTELNVSAVLIQKYKFITYITMKLRRIVNFSNKVKFSISCQILMYSIENGKYKPETERKN
jgi:hypothetical protein